MSSWKSRPTVDGPLGSESLDSAVCLARAHANPRRPQAATPLFRQPNGRPSPARLTGVVDLDGARIHHQQIADRFGPIDQCVDQWGPSIGFRVQLCPPYLRRYRRRRRNQRSRRKPINAITTPPTSRLNRKDSISRIPLSSFVNKHATGMPISAMVLLTAASTGGIPHPPLVWTAPMALRTHRPPARRLSRHGEAMAHAHLKAILLRIDFSHTGSEMGTVTFTPPQDQIHPGMNHLVAERALDCFLGQRSKHRP